MKNEIDDKKCTSQIERLDVFLARNAEDVSRNYLQKIIESGNVTINGKVQTSKKVKVTSDDDIVIDWPAPVFTAAEPENIPINIVYEDEDVIVVDKQKGLVVHPAAGNYTGTLVNALLFHCSDLSTINGVIRPGIVHRIDKDTSGLLVCAKNNIAHQSLAVQLKNHTMNRTYHAIVHGILKSESGTINKQIGRSTKNRLKMAILENSGKEAVTHFKLLKQFEKFAYVELKLETGRTHQIRVHMASINHPLLGDMTYGINKKTFGMDTQLLHAKVLGFVHPKSDKYVEFQSELPEYYKNVLEKIDRR